MWLLLATVMTELQPRKVQIIEAHGTNRVKVCCIAYYAFF